jgi:hypothetical protein
MINGWKNLVMKGIDVSEVIDVIDSFILKVQWNLWFEVE